jgi:hypothetical protein
LKKKSYESKDGIQQIEEPEDSKQMFAKAITKKDNGETEEKKDDRNAEAVGDLRLRAPRRSIISEERCCCNAGVLPALS